MTPIESQALAEVMFWYAVIIIIFAAGAGLICHIYDCIEETPEERAHARPSASPKCWSNKQGDRIETPDTAP